MTSTEIKKIIEELKKGINVKIDNSLLLDGIKLFYVQYHKSPCLSCSGDKIKVLELLLNNIESNQSKNSNESENSKQSKKSKQSKH